MTQTQPYNRHAFAVGTKVRVTDRFGTNGHLVPGREFEVTGCRATMSSGFQVRIDDLNTEYGSDWFVLAEAPEDREYIPFSLTKETSKRYAALSNSRKLEDDQRNVLDAAANGQEVDAWAFHTAVTAALSLAATRAGQSMGRREYTKMARHLLYISGAVLENSLRGLPPVDPGTRSPKIAEQKREIDDLRATVQRMAADVRRANDAVEAEKTLRAEAIVEKTEVEAAWKRLAESGRNQRRQFDYAMSLLDTESKFKVVGFGDALSEA